MSTLYSPVSRAQALRGQIKSDAKPNTEETLCRQGLLSQKGPLLRRRLHVRNQEFSQKVYNASFAASQDAYLSLAQLWTPLDRLPKLKKD